MSLEHIKAVVGNFTPDTHNELLVIKGKWGAGKTFFWQKLVEDCQGKKMCRQAVLFLRIAVRS